MASTLERQVGRVRVRMLLGSLLASVAWGWVVALTLAVCWFLSQPYLFPDAPEWLRWAVLGGLAGAATLAAVVLTVLRAPTPVAAALSLDERFALKERVTTSITLAPDEAASPAGQALLQDVEQRLGQVRIGDRFPVRLPWKPAALLPLGALAILCVVFFWNPRVGASRVGEESESTNPVAKEDIDTQMKQLAGVKKRDKKPDDPVKPADLKRIDDDLERFTRRPRETRDDIKDRIKDATALEDEIRRRQQEQAARIDAFKEQMKQAERLQRKNRGEKKDNPGKKAADALARGDMKKAQEEFQRLADEMKKEEEEKERLRRKKRDPKATEEERKKAEEDLEKLERESKLSRKDKEDLKKQMEDLQDQLERLSRNKDEIEKDLKDMAERGEIDKEELDRELEQLKKNSEKLSPEEIKEMAEAMKECKECMEKGDNEGAAKAMEKAAKAAGKMGKEGDGQEMQQKLVQIIKVKKALCRALGNKPGQGSGRRPESKDNKDTGEEEKFSPGEWGKGKKEVVGDGPMGGFKGPRKPSEMTEEIRQAAQEAPAAIDRQRLPPSARKMARGYFEKVRGPDKANKAPIKDAKKP